MVVQIAQGYLLYLAAHRGREEQGVALLGQVFENLVDALREAHVEHLVGLVEHDGCHLCDVGLASVDQVDESSGRGHDDVRPVAQGAYLLLDAGTAIDGYHVHTFHIFREVADVVGYLQTQFARRTEHQCLCLSAVGVEPLQQRNAEGRCLARTRLRQGYQVGSVHILGCLAVGVVVRFFGFIFGVGGDVWLRVQ